MPSFLRDELRDMIQRDGYPYLFLIQSRKIRCTMWDGKEHPAECMHCAGTGWTVRWARRKAMKQNASDVVSHHSLTRPVSAGEIWSPAYVFFTDPTLPLHPGDRIYDVGWRQGKPWGLSGVYDIRHAEQVRGEGGKPVYLYIGAMHLSTHIGFHERLIQQMMRGSPDA